VPSPLDGLSEFVHSLHTALDLFGVCGISLPDPSLELVETGFLVFDQLAPLVTFVRRDGTNEALVRLGRSTHFQPPSDRREGAARFPERQDLCVDVLTGRTPTRRAPAFRDRRGPSL
jgi:hypothetical protein